MQIYNWNYREWHCRKELRQNTPSQERIIPRTPVVRKVDPKTVEEVDDSYPRKFTCMTQSDIGLTEYTVFEDLAGFLCLEIQYPNGEHVITEPVINCFHMRAHLLCKADDKKAIVCIISLNDFTDKLILLNKNICSEGFKERLSKKEISIYVSEYKKDLVAEMVFMYLMRYATVSELPDDVGWCQNKSRCAF